MKKKFFLNANIIDPYNAIDEIGGLIVNEEGKIGKYLCDCLLYTSPSPRDLSTSRMPSSA